jgi:ABC-2 type transport system permease protein
MKQKHLSIIAKKEFRGLLNERTILLAVLLQLFIAMFSSFLMVGLTSMYDPSSLSKYSSSRYSIAYAGNDSQLLTNLQTSKDFRVYQMDLSTAVAALKERKLAAVIYVPDTQPDAQAPVKITLYTLQNDLQTAIVEVKLRDIFLKYEQDLREIRADRLKQEIVQIQIPKTGGGGDFYEFVYGLLIPLLVFMPAIIASALVIDLITEEYQHETLETLISTPVTFVESDCLRGARAHPGRCMARSPDDQRYRDPEFRIDPAPGYRNFAYPDPAWSSHGTALPRTYCCTVHLFHGSGSCYPVCPCFAIKSS